MENPQIIEVTYDEWLDIFSAIEEAARHFVLRDQMNACMHLSEVRYSPLTTMMDSVFCMMPGIFSRSQIKENDMIPNIYAQPQVKEND